MKRYNVGTQFIVCGVKYLVNDLGWFSKENHSGEKYYYHDDFPNLSISPLMLAHVGETLTIKNGSIWTDWYSVNENRWYWPVATFLEAKVIDFTHTCEEGMTPIDGWFICKTCGTNLKEIK